MKVPEVKDKISLFFRISFYFLRPYLRRKYLPKKEKNLADHVEYFVVWVGSWVVVAGLYSIFVYLFFVDAPSENTGLLKFLDFFQRAPIDVLKAVFEVARVSLFFNLAFLLILYFAVLFYAEKEFVKGKVLHYDLSGLIKVITVGGFDASSRVAEQGENQVSIARRNLLAAVENAEARSITIVTPSGWDFFGSGHRITNLPVTSSQKKKTIWIRLDAWWQRYIGDDDISDTDCDNGYLLSAVAQRSKQVRIILLDPLSAASQKRANDYIGGTHTPLKNASEYGANINLIIDKLKQLQKTNPNIEIRLVDELPEWKILLAKDEVWVQPVISGMRSDHTPLYGFKNTEYSQYHAFWNLADDLWHNRSKPQP